MRKFEYEGQEDDVIRLLQDMLIDSGWSQDEIDKYILARI